MYLTSIMDDAANRLSLTQSQVLGILHEQDYDAGMWLYNDEAAGLGAFEENYDGAVVYWQFRSNAEHDTVIRICDMVCCYVDAHTRCNHYHDCCGCTFLSGIDVAVMHSRSDEKTYVVVERWGRNV